MYPTREKAMMMMMGGNVVFTAAQWEELEQQALIYKYMVSGVPVPTELILSVRRSLFHSPYSSSSSSSLNHSVGYNQLYQMGGGGRKIDLEPGRCRRTDGKKWRCSKEAYPDSKYCERHMHRGRNRSRKPVEFSSSSSSSSLTMTTTPLMTSKSMDTYPLFASTVNQSDSYRYLQQGMKDLGEFQVNDLYATQKMASASHFSFQNLKEEEEEEAGKCIGDGIVVKNDEKLAFHHFFSPPNDPAAWVEVDQRQNLMNPPRSPLSTQDLFQSKPRPYW